MYFKQCGDEVNINGEVFLPKDQFRLLEPTYPEMPKGYNVRYYEPGKHHVLTGFGVPSQNLGDTWEDGDRFLNRIEDFKRLKCLILQQEYEDTKDVKKVKFDRLPYQEKRTQEYPSTEQMIVALWEHLIEKQSKENSGVEKLQNMRSAIKKKYPKDKDNT